MSFVSKHKSSRLLMSRNGGLRNVTMLVRAEHNCSNISVDGDFDSISDDDGNRVDDKQMPLGNVGQLFPKMGEETLRILLELEFPLVGFQLIDDFGPHGGIHMVVVDQHVEYAVCSECAAWAGIQCYSCTSRARCLRACGIGSLSRTL